MQGYGRNIMTIFTVPGNTTIDSDATFGALVPGDTEQVFGSAINTTIMGTIFDTEQDVEAGGSADTTSIFGGEQQVFPGGVATHTTIAGGAGGAVGVQQVDVGGNTDQTTINSGGMQVILGGSVTNTTINQGGQQILQASDGGPGTATGTTINGGTQTVDFGTATTTTINSGEQDVGLQHSGTAIGTTINGGLQVVGPNGTADNTTIQGGVMHVMAGGVTEGTITFAGVGTLVSDQPVSVSTSFATTLAGIQPGDTIDLTGLPFVPAATGAGLSGSQLTVSNGSNSETFTLQNLDSTVTRFLVTSDGNGGTDVTASDFSLSFKKVAYEVVLPHTVFTAPSGTATVAAVTPDAGSTVTAGNGAPNTIITNGATSAATPSALASPLSNDPANTLNGADSGKDTFVFSGDFGQNTINNFITRNMGNHDILELSKAQFGDLATMIKNGDIQQVGNDTIITNPLNSADTIKLIGVSAVDLESHPSDFHFV
jgi:autotransporter passenger strand-loop-strand repeat protein